LEETNCCYSFFPRKSEIAKRRRGDLIALRWFRQPTCGSSPWHLCQSSDETKKINKSEK
jgi:hypothetical protein